MGDQGAADASAGGGAGKEVAQGDAPYGSMTPDPAVAKSDTEKKSDELTGILEGEGLKGKEAEGGEKKPDEKDTTDVDAILEGKEDAKKDGEKAKDEKGKEAGSDDSKDKSDAEGNAPESYDLSGMPDGFKLEGDELASTTALAKDLDLTQDGFNKAMAFILDRESRQEAARQTAFQEFKQESRHALETDEKLGGDHLPETLAAVRAAVKGIDGVDDMVRFLSEVGVVNDVAVMGALANIGKPYLDDTIDGSSRGRHASGEHGLPYDSMTKHGYDT